MSQAEEPRDFCFRQGPGEQCRSFLLFDLHGFHPLNDPTRSVGTDYQLAGTDPPERRQGTTTRRELDWGLGWNLGLAFNLGPQWAAGLVGGYERSPESTSRKTLGVRVHHWLPRGMAVSLTPSFFTLQTSDSQRGQVDFSGVGADARLSVGRAVFLGVRYDRLVVDPSTYGRPTYLYLDPGTTEHQWSVGAGFEGTAGAVTSVVGLGILAALLAVALSSLT